MVHSQMLPERSVSQLSSPTPTDTLFYHLFLNNTTYSVLQSHSTQFHKDHPQRVLSRVRQSTYLNLFRRLSSINSASLRLNLSRLDLHTARIVLTRRRMTSWCLSMVHMWSLLICKDCWGRRQSSRICGLRLLSWRPHNLHLQQLRYCGSSWPTEK